MYTYNAVYMYVYCMHLHNAHYIMCMTYCTVFMMLYILFPTLFNHVKLLLHSLSSSPSSDSGSARYKAEILAKTIQSRIEENKTSHSVHGKVGLSIYARDPIRKNSIFLGNLTWVSAGPGLICTQRTHCIPNILVERERSCLSKSTQRKFSGSRLWGKLQLLSPSVCLEQTCWVNKLGKRPVVSHFYSSGTHHLIPLEALL